MKGFITLPGCLTPASCMIVAGHAEHIYRSTVNICSKQDNLKEDIATQIITCVQCSTYNSPSLFLTVHR